MTTGLPSWRRGAWVTQAQVPSTITTTGTPPHPPTAPPNPKSALARGLGGTDLRAGGPRGGRLNLVGKRRSSLDLSQTLLPRPARSESRGRRFKHFPARRRNERVTVLALRPQRRQRGLEASVHGSEDKLAEAGTSASSQPTRPRPM